MLMHVTAHEGCTDTARESALKVDSGRKIPCQTGDLNLPQWCAGWMPYQLSYILSVCVCVAHLHARARVCVCACVRVFA